MDGYGSSPLIQIITMRGTSSDSEVDEDIIGFGATEGTISGLEWKTWITVDSLLLLSCDTLVIARLKGPAVEPTTDGMANITI